MREIKIRLTRRNREIGIVKFGLLNAKTAVGTLGSVRVPEDKDLESEILRHMKENPEAIAIFGGTIPVQIGSYGDGVLAVLDYLSKKRDFDFDPSVIPLPTFPPGAIG